MSFNWFKSEVIFVQMHKRKCKQTRHFGGDPRAEKNRLSSCVWDCSRFRAALPEEKFKGVLNKDQVYSRTEANMRHRQGGRPKINHAMVTNCLQEEQREGADSER